DHILHAHATQALGGLFAQHPGDGVGDIGLPTTVGAHHRGNTFTRKLQFGPVAEGFESKDLQPLHFEHRPTPSGMPNRNPAQGRAVLNICLTSAGTTPANVPRELTGVKHKAHKMLWITCFHPSMSHPGCKVTRHSSACKAWMRWRGESLESEINFNVENALKQAGKQRKAYRGSRGSTRIKPKALPLITLINTDQKIV